MSHLVVLNNFAIESCGVRAFSISISSTELDYRAVDRLFSRKPLTCSTLFVV